MAATKRTKLTDAAVARLRPREREYTVWDSRVTGLGGPGPALRRAQLGIAARRRPRARSASRSARSPRRPSPRPRRDALGRQADPRPKKDSGTTDTVPLFRDFVARSVETRPLGPLQAVGPDDRVRAPEAAASARIRDETARPHFSRPRPAVVRPLQPHRARRRQSRLRRAASDHDLRRRLRPHRDLPRPLTSEETAARRSRGSCRARRLRACTASSTRRPATTAGSRPTSSACFC